MIGTRSPVGVPAPGNAARETTAPGVRDLVARLRDAADQMIAFSRTKTLLRDAAATIEQLDAAAQVNRSGLHPAAKE
jgi:hypothetical protein